MLNYKMFLSTVVIISVLLQLSSMLLDKTSYSKLFKAISGILITIIIVSLIITSIKKVDNSEFKYNFQKKEYQSPDIKTEFENNLKVIIDNDLHNIDYVNLLSNIETDLNKIIIYIHGITDISDGQKVKKYIQSKYCTADDEVIIVYE